MAHHRVTTKSGENHFYGFSEDQIREALGSELIKIERRIDNPGNSDGHYWETLKDPKE